MGTITTHQLWLGRRKTLRKRTKGVLARAQKRTRRRARQNVRIHNMGQSLLTINQQKLLGFISKEPYLTSQFFLTGGTALSEFYFQHRFSEDFDLFSETEFDARKIITWVQKTKSSLGFDQVEQQSLSGQETFFFYASETDFVKVDFAYFPFSHLGTFKKHNNLMISSVDDISINKIHAVTTRKRARDYLDLFFCIPHLGWKLSDILKNYHLKFDVSLPPEQLATSFTNVLDAQDEPRFLGDVDWEKVEEYFLSLAKELKGELLK